MVRALCLRLMYRYSPSEMVCLDEKYLPKIRQKIFHQNESDQIIQELFCVDVCDRPGLHGLCMCGCVQQAQSTWIVYVCDRPSQHGLCVCVTGPANMDCVCVCVRQAQPTWIVCVCV